MSKKWFEMKEEGVGEKRLWLTWKIYQIFGEIPVRIIAFFVSISIFIMSKERRNNTYNFYKLINKHPFWSSLKLFLNYGNSLVDKLLSFSGNLNPDKFILKNGNLPNETFYITTHIGNVEILRTLFLSDKFPHIKRANIFLQGNACQVYNSFLKNLETETNIDTFAVEEISAETSVIIEERLKNNEIVFMAADRISAQNENKIYEGDFLGQKIKLPLGTLKFALMLNVPICFIICVRDGINHIIYTKHFVIDEKECLNKKEKLEVLKKAYCEFMEEYAQKYPYQFYHFHQIN